MIMIREEIIRLIQESNLPFNLSFFFILFKLIIPNRKDKIAHIEGDKKNNINDVNNIEVPFLLGHEKIKRGMTNINIIDTKLAIANPSYFFLVVFLFFSILC